MIQSARGPITLVLVDTRSVTQTWTLDLPGLRVGVEG